MPNCKPVSESAMHYDLVTTLWQKVLGEHFHFGCFAGDVRESIAEATQRLIERSAHKLQLSHEDRLVDIGCGVGGPARWLAAKYGCQVLAISNSQVGVATAESLRPVSEERERLLVTYLCADALSNGLPSEHFDVVWCMEAAHLFENKSPLISECFRLLKPNGRLMLCDLVLGASYPITHSRQQFKSLIRLRQAFGPVFPVRAAEYLELLESHFPQVEQVNLSSEVQQTGRAWVNIIDQSMDALESVSTTAQVQALRTGAQEIDDLLQKAWMGYALFSARKDS